MIRSDDLLSYTLFEEETLRYRTTDYHWNVNKNGNLIGLDKNERVCFTWQPHGSQFTIHTEIPDIALRFTIKQPPKLEKKDILDKIKFDSSWVTIVKK